MSIDLRGVTILQFGTGRFLRAFVDRFVSEANTQGQSIGQILAVQSTGSDRSKLINQSSGGFPVWVRGIHDGLPIDRQENVKCLRAAISANENWRDVLRLAESPDLRFVISNTTEAGYAVSDEDHSESNPPASFPAKLTQLLWNRFKSGMEPVVVLPCELIERNADRLREIVTGVARRWALPDAFLNWMQRDCQWGNNLVDCIVTPAPQPEADAEPLLICAEPFRLWAIEKPPESHWNFLTNPDVHFVDDLAPYYLRKVRILNGAHTAMAAKFLPRGFETVLQVMQNREASRWVKDLIFEEIVPTICSRVPGAAAFAESTVDRFRNPSLHHRLSDIAKNQAEKWQVRIEPTRSEFERLYGKPPSHIADAAASRL